MIVPLSAFVATVIVIVHANYVSEAVKGFQDPLPPTVKKYYIANGSCSGHLDDRITACIWNETQLTPMRLGVRIVDKTGPPVVSIHRDLRVVNLWRVSPCIGNAYVYVSVYCALYGAENRRSGDSQSGSVDVSILRSLPPIESLAV